MSQSRDDGSHHTSSSSPNEGYTCSSPFAKEPSQADVTVEDDKRDNLSVAETNFQGEALYKKELKSDACRAEDENGEKQSVNIEGDLEEGEIQDTPNSKFFDAYSCRYYQKGFCVYGKDCPFLHLSDKGLYSMFDYPAAVTKSVSRPSQFIVEQKCILVTPAFENVETDFDRDLKKAMERTKESKKRGDIRCEKLCMTIQSDECIAKKPILTKSLKDRCNQSHVSKARGSRSKKEHSYEIETAKAKLTGGDLSCKTTYRLDSRNLLKRSGTPRHMRWSPKSVSDSSRSRSHSRSSCNQCSCSRSCTPSPKRGRRVMSSRVSNSYWRRHASSSSESSWSCSVFKKVSRRANRRNPRSKSPVKKAKTSNRRSPFKILLPRELERERTRSPKREVSRSFVPSKIQVTGKLVPLHPKSSNRSCSDMSISPLSDSSSNEKDGHPGERPVVCYSSERHVSDLSISPLCDASSPDRFSRKTEGTDPSVSKSNVKKLDVDQKGLSNGLDLAKSGSRKKTTRGESLYTSRSISKPSAGMQIKKSDPLMADLLKFHRNLKTGCHSFHSSPDRFSRKSEGTDPSVSKSNVKKINVDVDQKELFNGLDLSKSGSRKNTTRGKSLFTSRTISKPSAGTQIKKSNPLLSDLLKFHSNLKTGDSFEDTKNVPSRTPVKTDASKLADGLIKRNVLKGIKQKTSVNQCNLSRKDILLKRLQEINAAIEKRKIFAHRKVSENV